MDRSRLILISSSVVVFVGLCITGYFLFAGDDKPTWDPSRPKPKPLVPKTYGASTDEEADTTEKQQADSASAITTELPEDQAWFVEADREMRFRVNLPGATESFTPGETIDESSPGYAVLRQTFSEVQGFRTTRSTVDYSVTAGILIPDDADTRTRLASFADKLPEMLPGFEIQKLQEISLDAHPGVEVILATAERKKARIQRIYIAGERMILQAVEGPDVDATDPFVGGFFQSLVIEDLANEQRVKSNSVDLDWAEITGAALGFQLDFPSPDVKRLNILETLHNVSTRSLLSDKWQEQRAQHESIELQTGDRTYTVTAFLETNRTAPEFSRKNMQKARLDAIVKFSYGNDVVKRELVLPSIAGAECEEVLVRTDKGEVILVRSVITGFSSYLLRVEGPRSLKPSDEAAIRFLTSLKVAAGVTTDPSAASKYRRAIVKRFHPYSGLDVQLLDGSILSIKPTSLTSLLDPRGEEYEITDNLLAETVLKVGGKVDLVVEPPGATNLQRYVRQIQVVDDSRSSL